MTKYGPGHERQMNDMKLSLSSIRTAEVCHFLNTRFVLALKTLTHNFSFASHIIVAAERGNGHKYSYFLLNILNLLNDHLY